MKETVIFFGICSVLFFAGYFLTDFILKRKKRIKITIIKENGNSVSEVVACKKGDDLYEAIEMHKRNLKTLNKG